MAGEGRRLRPVFTWSLARRLTQYLALALFVALFIASRRGGWPPELVNLPMRLDPLIFLSHLLSSLQPSTGSLSLSKAVEGLSLLALITLLLTFVFGRAWCGWLCPLGTLLDLLSPRLVHRRKGRLAPRRQPRPERRGLEGWRAIKYVLLAALLILAALGNLTLLVLDPLAIVLRTLGAAAWPALDQFVTRLEALLYRLPGLADPVSALDAVLRPGLLPSEPAFYQGAWLLALFFLGLVLLNWIAPRFWCRYLCPLGGLLGLVSKAALFRRQVGEACQGCTLCTQACPTGTIDPQQDYASDPAECTMCMDCLDACPRSGIVFRPSTGSGRGPSTDPGSGPSTDPGSRTLTGSGRGWQRDAWRPYDPGRREFLLAAGGALAAWAVLRSDAAAKRTGPFVLRPPGVRRPDGSGDLLESCVRCAECLRACPTGALQPALGEAGVEGIWTPLLVPRLGYCEYSCNACGQVCPVGAIPPLELEAKRQQVIGKAYIDQDRCIAWADHSECLVCEEMCPIPDKAIRLEERQVRLPGGEMQAVRLPVVLRELCTGCGLCEYKCPLNGESAIRVYVPNAPLPF